MNEPVEKSALDELNEVQLTPEQFEQELIEVSRKLWVLERKFVSDDQAIVDRMVDEFGPQCPVVILEKVLKFYTDQITDIKQNRLVSMLKTINAKKWVSASNGLEVEIKKKMSVSLSDCDKTLLAGWLEAHKLGYLIKDTLAFEKGELTPEVVAELREQGLHFERNSEVNTASLKPVLVLREDNGDPLPPPEACKTTIFELADVKFPKEKK